MKKSKNVYIVQEFDLENIPKEKLSPYMQHIMMSLEISKNGKKYPFLANVKGVYGWDNNLFRKLERIEEIKEYKNILVKTEKYDGDAGELLKSFLDEGKQSKILKLFKDLSKIFYEAAKGGFYHGDPKLSNIVYKKNKDQYELYFIDFEYSCFFPDREPTRDEEILIRNNMEFLREEFYPHSSLGTIYILPPGYVGHYNIETYKGFRAYLKDQKVRYPLYVDFPVFIGTILLYYTNLLLDNGELLSALNTSFYTIHKKFIQNEKSFEDIKEFGEML